MSELLVDLQATVDYIKGEVTERADSFDFESKARTVQALVAVKRAADEAMAMLRQEMLKELERGERRVGSTLYVRKPKRVEKYNHDRVASLVASRIYDSAPLNEQTGERDHLRDAERAVALMRKLYLSNSSKVKVTELDRADIPRSEIVTKERNGYEMIVIDSDPDDDE